MGHQAINEPLIPKGAVLPRAAVVHLYQWRDAVEVLEPKALREMVEGYRRSDFYPALP